MDNNEDTDELALYFAAKKENEELREKIIRLETNISRMEDYRKVLDNRVLDKESHIKSLISASTYLKDQYSQMLTFIKQLDKYPMFWGSSYKSYIKRFLDR